MNAIARPRAGEDFTGEYNVYEPHKVGLPPLGPYFRALWARKQFLFELARTNLRAQHYNTTFGQLWLILNPLMMAGVYFTLVYIIRDGGRGPVFLAHLMLSLFAFRLVSTAISRGAQSIVGGGKLLLNTAFPRLLLPLEAVLESFMRFLPTVAVYAVVHAILGLPIGPDVLWIVPIIALMTIFGAGAAMFAATAQVYFRDLASFLRYFTRIWLYTSPILFYAEDVPAKLQTILYVNPMYPMLGSLNDAVIEGRTPPFPLVAASLAWALGAIMVGAVFFMSREREFAIRL
ncbi:MAG TPA: ABC transporter permease [Gaiellaceae bacterium]|nr:ABC transporter permease [Gaiellaceae bacterium]